MASQHQLDFNEAEFEKLYRQKMQQLEENLDTIFAVNQGASEAYMKLAHKWQNRTYAAETALHTNYTKQDGVRIKHWNLKLTGDLRIAPHGRFLENNSRYQPSTKYAVIIPTGYLFGLKMSHEIADAVRKGYVSWDATPVATLPEEMLTKD